MIRRIPYTIEEKMMLTKRFSVLFAIVMLGGSLVYMGWLHRPGRYIIQTVTHKSTHVSGGNIDWQVCLKIDRLTGRTWVLEGSHVNEHSDMYFREIPDGLINATLGRVGRESGTQR